MRVHKVVIKETGKTLTLQESDYCKVHATNSRKPGVEILWYKQSGRERLLDKVEFYPWHNVLSYMVENV